MKLHFTKMHGQGNDFVMINAVRHPEYLAALTPERVRSIADRHKGIGCDQLLVVEPSTGPDVDFRYRIFNADGGEVEHCGNGARCFARFVRDEGLTDKMEIRVQTMTRVVIPRIDADGRVTVDMGAPMFEPADIPFLVPTRLPSYVLRLNQGERKLGALSMGNPHVVQQVPDVDSAPVVEEGAELEHHPAFPRRVNAGFMQVVSQDHIRLRVWERGAGETLACGTGACAAVVTGILWGLLAASVRVSTRGGDLRIQWAGGDNPVFLSGSATTVFRGEFELD